MERMNFKRLLILLTTQLLISITSLVPVSLGATASIHTDQDPGTFVEYSSRNTTLQDAINQAQPGATLQLAAGSYTEILTIDKPIHLKGQGSMHTILCPTSPTNGYAVRITTEGVTLSDLSITNQGPGIYTTCVKICAAKTTILNCTFHDTPIGIAIWNSTNTISGCDFRGCDDEGIVLLGSSTIPCTNNTIASCTFYENCDGIELQYATYNQITSCTFSKNTHAGIDAIVSNNNDNIISRCEFNSNQGFGLYLAGSSHNLITQCSFSDDTIAFVHASNNTLLKSRVNKIHLMQDSSLRIEQCMKIEKSAIITQQSSYEIFTEEPEQAIQGSRTYNIEHHAFLVALLSRFKILKSFYEQINQLRM
jgi:parallel beta-helix repeat protein